MISKEQILYAIDFNIKLSEKQKELFKSILTDKIISPVLDHDDFYYNFLYPIDTLLDNIIYISIKKDSDISFILKNSHFLEFHFTNIFDKIEGYACSSDKAKTVIRGILNYFISGEKIHFNRFQEFTYHIPTEIFTSHESIMEFYEALNSLYYGDSINYIKIINIINQHS